MFLFLLNTAMIFLIAFFVVKKKLNLLENLFIFIMQVFLISSCFAILHVNLNAWQIPISPKSMIIFRIYEAIIIPLLYVTYFNILATIKSRLVKMIFTIIYIFVLYGAEFLLVIGKIIIYHDWSFWQSILAISFILLISNILQRGFSHVLQKEGVKR